MIVRLHKQDALFNEREINHPGLSNYPQALLIGQKKTVLTTGASSK